MRVLHVIESLARAGAEQALVNVVPELRAQGIDVHVAALWKPYALAPDIERGGATVHRLDVRHRWNLPQAVGRVVALARRLHCDVLHAHSFFSGLYVALSRVGYPDCRRFVTFHNLGYDAYPAVTPWLKARKRLDSYLMNHAIDRRLAVSDAVADHYRKHLNLDQVTVIHNAIAVEAAAGGPATEEIRARHGVGANDSLLLLCGRFVKEKGHRYLLDALNLLLPRYPRVKALMVGDGPLKADVERLIVEKRLEGVVRTHPALAHADLVRVMAASDIIVVPSTHEGFPLAPAEAMMLGKPVVASSVGGLPSLIADGDSGFLVAPGDVSQLTEAIARFLEAPDLRARIGENGRRYVRSQLSPPVVASQLVSSYRADLKGEPSQ